MDHCRVAIQKALNSSNKDNLKKSFILISKPIFAHYLRYLLHYDFIETCKRGIQFVRDQIL